jgi:5,10-methylenetetrahydromethanopterin reductase
MVQLGISAGLSPRESLDRFVKLIQSAEQQGVDACWVIDSQLAMKDAFVVLSVLAHQTERIQLGPGVTNMITRHETVIANLTSTLASIAPGRIALGLGSGDSSILPLGYRTMRVAECEAGVERMRSLITGEEVSGPAGSYRLSFVPDIAPPIFFAGTQRRMLQLTGRVADGAIIMGPSNPDFVSQQLARIDEGARDAGRDPGSVFRDLWVTMSVGQGESPIQDVKSWASAQARLLAPSKELPDSLERFREEMNRAVETYQFSSHLSLSAPHAEAVSDEFAKVLAIAGTFDECANRLRGLADLGPDRITVTLLTGGREDRLDTLVRLWDECRLHEL